MRENLPQLHQTNVAGLLLNPNFNKKTQFISFERECNKLEASFEDVYVLK
jgi:hypothetical protein